MEWIKQASKDDESLDGLRAFLGLPKRTHVIVIPDIKGALTMLGYPA